MTEEHWLFAYGSLMWSPGFSPVEAVPARLAGYHRAFCILSWHHRGTREAPGLVLGLDRGGACRGLAYRLAPETLAETLAYLRARELVTDVYREARVPIELESPGGGAGRRVLALAYVVDRHHPQYAGRLPLPQQARLIADGVGASGANLDYMRLTLDHLEAAGDLSAELRALRVAVEALIEGGPPPQPQRE